MESEDRSDMENAYKDAVNYFDSSASEMKLYFRKEIEMVDKSEMSWNKLIELILVYLFIKRRMINLNPGPPE